MFKICNTGSAYYYIVRCSTRACLKNHSCHLHAPLCGIFGPDSVGVAHYDSFIGTKSSTKCNAQLSESIFQTRLVLQHVNFMEADNEKWIWLFCQEEEEAKTLAQKIREGKITDLTGYLAE